MFKTSNMLKLEIVQIDVHNYGEFVTLWFNDTYLNAEVTTGLNAFVGYKQDTTVPKLMRVKELEVGDSIWIDRRLLS